MWAVLFLLGCTIDSIGCTIFDENHASEYEDFHDNSYSYSDDDDDYEDEYSDPAIEAPRVRRYDRMTHTVPTPALTMGLPEVKDALQMLMLGRNLSASEKKELEAGSKFMYPIDATMSTDAISPRPTEELEIPIDFYEIKVSTKTMGTGETPIEFYDITMAIETTSNRETPIEFYDFKPSTETTTTSEKPTRSRDHPMEPPRTYFKEQLISVGFTEDNMEPPRTYFKEQPTIVGLTDHTKEPSRTYFKEQPTIVGLTDHTKEPSRTNFKEQPTIVGFTEHITANQITIESLNSNATVEKPTRMEFMDIENTMIPFDTNDMNAIWNRSQFFKNSAQEELFTIDNTIITSVTEPTELTEETPQNQTVYVYEHSKNRTDAYIDSTEINLLRTGPAALPVTRTKAVFQTVFLYENDRPENEYILGMDDDGTDDKDGDGIEVSGNWSDEYDPLEFLLTDNLRSGLREPAPDDSATPETNTPHDSTANTAAATSSTAAAATSETSTAAAATSETSTAAAATSETSTAAAATSETSTAHVSTAKTTAAATSETSTAAAATSETSTAHDSTANTTATEGTTTKKKKKSKKPKPLTTTLYPFDVEKFLELVANLTYDYYTNLTETLNMTLIKLGAPTCPTPTVLTTTPSTAATGVVRPDYSIMENKIMGKCFVCGLVDEGIPWNSYCSDAFAGDFLPLSPVDARAKGQLSKFRKYCRYDDVDHYVANETLPRTIFGRWTGGCGVRWTDISSIYTQRTCRNRNHPTTGKHYASKRMSKLEMALANTENGCIVSPIASLIPLSRGISLYARFHACVCTGSWCNVSWRLDSDSDVWKAYVIVGLLLVLR